MKKPYAVSLFLFGFLSVTPTMAVTTLAADTHVITGTHRSDDTFPVWESEGKESDNAQPLIVEVKKGDVLEIDINDRRMPHGFVTLSGKGTDQPTEKRNLVQTCAGSGSEAALKEIDCTATNVQPKDWFGNPNGFKGTVKLEVTNGFTDDVNFWCAFHKKIMWGIIKLKPQTP